MCVYPCVPSGSEEERQRTCSYHGAILLIVLDTLLKVEGSVYGFNSSFIILDNFCFYRILRTERGTETIMALTLFEPRHAVY